MGTSFLERLGRACFALVAAALSIAPELAAATCTNPLLVGGPGHPTPIVRPGRVAAPRAHLLYFGGPVVSNVSVTMVLWGRGSYAPFVTDTEPPRWRPSSRP